MFLDVRTDIASAPVEDRDALPSFHRPHFMAHTYLIGASGTGKSTLLKQYIREAIEAGHGVFYLDPHGHDTDELIQYIPKNRRQHTILFDPSREEVVGFNPLFDHSPLAISVLMDAIKDAWGYGEMPTPTMDMYLFFSLTVLAESKQTLADLPTFLTDSDYRSSCLTSVSDIVVREFWSNFDAMTPKEKRDQISSTLNKALMLIADKRVRKMLSQRAPSFELSDVVTDKILFARLPQGQLSKSRVSVLGSVLLSLIHQACLARDNSIPFHIFIDECHLFAPSVVKEMLSGIRKFGVELYLSHQYIEQLDRDYYSAIIGNASTQIVFRTSQDDAKRLVDRMARGKPDYFTDLADFTFRYFPVQNSHVGRVEPIAGKPYPKSEADILEHHRRHLWVK
ncbi:MAG: hypothetical protein C0429_09605 [Sphingopyxis sp.]|nr:hypothetical protein [Sphingopyxis sp.]